MVNFEPKRILILEDEALTAMVLGDMLSDLALEVLGPTHDVASAREIILHESIDGAIIDFKIGEATSHEIARLLAERGVPYIITSGYRELEPLSGSVGILYKPYVLANVVAAVGKLFPAETYRK